jgi:hypothetical protein
LPGELEMTLSTSDAAVCCCSDSRNSFSSRMFSMAMTAWLYGPDRKAQRPASRCRHARPGARTRHNRQPAERRGMLRGE